MFAKDGLFQETHQDADKAQSKVHSDAAAQSHTRRHQKHSLLLKLKIKNT